MILPTPPCCGWTAAASLFDASDGVPSCRQCHGEDLAGAYTRYPRYAAEAEMLVSASDRINRCRAEQQGLAPLPADDEDLLAVTMYVASLSQGMPYAVTITGAAEPYFERAGRTFSNAAASSTWRATSVTTRTGARGYAAIPSARVIPLPSRATAWNGRVPAHCTVVFRIVTPAYGHNRTHREQTSTRHWSCTWPGGRETCPSRYRA